MRKSTLTIRPSLAEDEADIAEVEASATATLRRVYRPNALALSHRKSLARDLMRLVAVRNGRVLGTVQYFEEGEAIRVVALGVHEQFRRCGVARALIAGVMEIARKRRLSALVAQTVKETGNVPIFEALGFAVASEQPDRFGISVGGGSLTNVELWMGVGATPGSKQGHP